MLGFIGCGNMAKAMLKGILDKGTYKKDEIIVSGEMRKRWSRFRRSMA